MGGVWACLLVVATLLGILSGIAFFAPSATVDFGDLADPANLLSVLTTVKNDGAVTLYDVSVELGLCTVQGSTAAGKPVTMRGACQSTGDLESLMVLDKWQHHKMLSGEKYSVAISELFSRMQISHLDYADISIAVSYRPWYFPLIHRTRQFRTVGAREQSGSYEWRFIPLDE